MGGQLDPQDLPAGVLGLHIVRYPFSRPVRVVERTGLAHGDVVLVEVASLEGDGPRAHYVRRLRWIHIGHPVAVWIRARGVDTPATRGGSGVRMVISGPFDAETFRESAKTLNWREVEAWCRHRLAPGSLDERGAVGALVDILRGIPASEIVGGGGRLTAITRHMGIPRPRRWTMLARALPGALSIQCTQGALTSQRPPEYAHQRVFRRHCRVLFDLAPSSVRLGCGWEPLLDRFVKFATPARPG